MQVKFQNYAYLVSYIGYLLDNYIKQKVDFAGG